MKRRPLLWQLYPSYLLITLVALVAVAWYASNSLRDFYLAQMQAGLLARARLIQPMMMETYRTATPEELDALAVELGQASNTRITFILPNGAVLADSERDAATMVNHADRREVQQALRGGVGRDDRLSDTLRVKMMYVASPAVEDGRVVAVIRTAFPLAAIDEALGVIYREIAVAGIVVALVAAILSWMVSRKISRPLQEMKEGAERFARGDFSQKLIEPDSLEIGMLSEAMNQMAQDLDARIRTIVNQRNEQQAVLSSMVEGVLAVDEEQRILSLNYAARQLMGVEGRGAEGKTIQEAVRNTELQHFIEAALASTEPVEAQIVMRDITHEHFLQTRGAALRDAAGRRIGAVVVLNDVTQLRRLESVRKDFVANVSHELKTPITSIKGFIETLMDGALNSPEDARRFLDIIARQTQRLNAIIDDLLTLSKIEQQTEKAEIALKPAPIRPVVSAATQLCEIKAQDKGIQIVAQCDETIQAQINAPLLEQAVVNLIDNAIKYSEPGSQVLVEARVNGQHVAIRVSDHGCGIEPQYLPRLFERFYRVDKARSRKLGGTGLGLAIVKHIAHAHGGRAVVESEPGKGSTFSILLPRV